MQESQTLAQFAAVRRAAYLAENPEVTGAAYDRGVVAAWVMDEWIDALHDLASRGQMLPPRVLDDIFRRRESLYWSLRHDHHHCCPEGYMNPEARESNRQREAEMRVARARGRTAGRPCFRERRET